MIWRHTFEQAKKCDQKMFSNYWKRAKMGFPLNNTLPHIYTQLIAFKFRFPSHTLLTEERNLDKYCLHWPRCYSLDMVKIAITITSWPLQKRCDLVLWAFQQCITLWMILQFPAATLRFYTLAYDFPRFFQPFCSRCKIVLI